VSDRGIVVDGTEYDLDTIIFGTGYSVGSNANVEHVPVIGRGNQTLQQKWGQDGMASLHGIMTFGFPNLFFPGPYQAGATANQVYLLDQLEESEVFKAARSCIWGQGIKSYVETIEEWRQNSRLAGLDIQYR
jgi:cation diffusion facilitator CzcD-associated flavoprotein CzcO